MEKVIIYRSQTEAKIDEMIWSSNGVFFETFVFAFFWVVVFICLSTLADSKFKKLFNRFGKNTEITVVALLSFPITYGVCKLISKLIFLI